MNELNAELVGISLCVKIGYACYIPISHKENNDDLFGAETIIPTQLSLETLIALLGPVFKDGSILKIGQNIKYDIKILSLAGFSIKAIDDTMLLSYALNAGLHNHSMDSLSERYLQHKPIPIKELIGSGMTVITFDKVPIPEAVLYAAEDADITLRLWELFRPELHKKNVTKVEYKFSLYDTN